MCLSFVFSFREPSHMTSNPEHATQQNPVSVPSHNKQRGLCQDGHPSQNWRDTVNFADITMSQLLYCGFV